MGKPKKPAAAPVQVLLFGVPHVVCGYPSGDGLFTFTSVKVGGIEVLDLYRWQVVPTPAGAVPLLTMLSDMLESHHTH